MPRVTWDAVGERFYEIGVDRGVLYPTSALGIAWSGLISVSETPSGGEPRPFYIDGIKYVNISAAEEFEAAIGAFSSPSEFSACDGVSRIQNGLLVTNQPRKPFGLSYRSNLGNDTDGMDHAYKIHLVYNALAAPSQRANNTIDDSVNPSIFNWSITTLPPAITGYKPTAHLVIDSRYTDPAKLSEIEDLLYGTVATSSSLPTPDELIAIFNA